MLRGTRYVQLFILKIAFTGGTSKEYIYIANEKYSQGEWKKLGWHDLFNVLNLIQGSFSS